MEEKINYLDFLYKGKCVAEMINLDNRIEDGYFKKIVKVSMMFGANDIDTIISHNFAFLNKIIDKYNQEYNNLFYEMSRSSLPSVIEKSSKNHEKTMNNLLENRFILHEKYRDAIYEHLSSDS